MRHPALVARHAARNQPQRPEKDAQHDGYADGRGPYVTLRRLHGVWLGSIWMLGSHHHSRHHTDVLAGRNVTLLWHAIRLLWDLRCPIRLWHLRCPIRLGLSRAVWLSLRLRIALQIAPPRFISNVE